MIVAGVEYVTTSEAAERLAPDVTPALLRDWKRRGLLSAVCDPHGVPVRLPSPSGPQNVFQWQDVVAAEYATRQSRSGRRRPA